MRKRLLIILCCLPMLLDAQSGSFILSKYTTNAYWNDSVFPPPANGKLYAYPLSDTFGNAWTNQLLAVFKFSPADYDGHCIDSIRMNGSFVADTVLNNSFNYYYSLNTNSGYRQSNPIRKYSFSLHGITDTAYTTFSPKTGAVAGSDTEICFFIIPGSGDNQTTAIIRNEGYHVLNCNVMNTLRKHGDVYIYIKPNEDARAIRVQQLPVKKMVTDIFPTDSYLNQFLISNYRHEGINYLIECVAAIKELKRKYKKVFLLGCSQGGYAGLYAALETEPDGALIASGYSVSLDDNYLQFGNVALKFAQLPFLLKKDSIKHRIAEQKSAYYFAWPTNDSPIYLAENQNHYTENYFNTGTPLSNANYLYTYANHAFPPCQYIDSFVKQVKNKPKAFVGDTLHACLYDSMVRKVTLIGQAPFSYSLYRDGILLNTFSNVPDTTELIVYQEGNYQLKDITDANGNNGIWSDVFAYKKYPKAELQIGSTSFDCDSNLTHVKIVLSGTPPFQLNTYKKDSAGMFQFYSASLQHDTLAELVLGNGAYRFDLQDAIACETLSDSVLIDEYLLNYLFLSEHYDCAQHLAKFEFSLQGKAPYTLTYIKDGNLFTKTEMNDNVTWWLDNGSYFLIDVTDANTCHYSINQAFNIQYDTLVVMTTAPLYQCDRNESMIDFHLEGNAPFQLSFSKNTLPDSLTLNGDTTMYYPNGNWQFVQLTDQTGCSFTFSTPLYQFNYDTFRVVMSTPEYQCDSNKSLLHFELDGNAPFSAEYLDNGIPMQQITNDSTMDILLPNGQYLIQQITDGMGCHLDTNQSYTFNYTPISAAISQQYYHCDSNKYRVELSLTGNMPWQIHYHNTIGSFIINSSNANCSLWLENESWMLDSIIDATACSAVLSIPVNVNYAAIQAGFASQGYDCDSNLYDVGLMLNGNAPWIINYLQAGTVPQYFSDTTYDPMQHYFLPTGSWTFTHVSDQTGCTVALSNTVVNNYQSLGYQQILKQYNCDSNKLALSYSFSGDAPWQFIYRNNLTGVLDTLQTNQPVLTFLLSNGQYTMLEVRDQNCIMPVNDTVNVQFTPLQSGWTQPVIDCDSGMYRIDLISSGGIKPYRYSFTYNSISDTIVSYQDTTVYYLHNGNYVFHQVEDSLHCTVQFNLVYTADYHPFHFDSLRIDYNCEKDSTRLEFFITHQHSLHLVYTINAGATDTLLIDQQHVFIVANGTYQWIALVDSLGCRQDIQQTTVIDHHPIRIDTVYLEKICDTKAYRYHLKLEGQSPWSLSYNYQNVPGTLLVPSSTMQWTVTPGAYYLVSLRDSTDCLLPIGRSDTLLPFLPGMATLQWLNNELIAMPEGYSYAWYRDQQRIDSTNANRLPTRGAGQYQVAVIDAAGCLNFSNILDQQYSTLIEAYPVPVTSSLNILVNEPFGRYWDYTLTDITGQKIVAGTSTRPYTLLDLSYLQAGVYNMLVVFENSKEKHILRIIKD